MSKLPQRLGNYRLVRWVHSGAMTEIWQAMTLDTNRPRMLKIQSPSAESPSMVAQRLKHEWAVAQSVHNPQSPQKSPLTKDDRAGVVQIFEHGVDSGLAFLAMERFSHCRSLRQILTDHSASASGSNQANRSEHAERTATSAEAEKTNVNRADGADSKNAEPTGVAVSYTGLVDHLPLVAERLAGALASLHWAGWLYGSLKPNNILLNEQWELRLVDLAGCSAISSKWKQWVPITGSGTGQGKLAGSPYYLSPEQIRKQTLDARSDIYSLGCLLYELIEGRVPYTGKTGSELLNKHLQAKIPQINRRSRYVTDELADLVAAMMEKSPDHRPRDMLTVQHELRSVFQKADPVDWNSLFGRGAEDDTRMDLAELSRIADRQRERQSRAQAAAGDSKRPRTWLAKQLDRVAAIAAKYGRRRWVQATSAVLLLGLIGWMALLSESTATEERVLAEFAQVLSGLNQVVKKPSDAAGFSSGVQPQPLSIDQLQSQAKRAVDLYRQEIAEPNPGKPIQMELHWASQVLPEAVAEASQPDRLAPVALGSLRTHVANATRYVEQARERRALAGPLGLKKIYESDLFFWSIVIVDVLGAAWIIKLLITGKRRRALE